MTVEFLHVDDASLGRLAAFGRAFCRHAASFCPESPQCAALVCRGVSRGAHVEGSGLWTRFTVADGVGAMRLSNALANELLECLLGGRGQGPPRERPLTALERSLHERIVGPLLRAWERAFARTLADARPPRETASGVLSPLSGPAVAWHVGVDGRSATALDLLMDEPCALALVGESPPTDEKRLLERLLQADCTLEVSIASTRATLGDLSRLERGAILPLDAPVDAPWILRSAGADLASVRPAAVHGLPHLIVTDARRSSDARSSA